MLSLFIVGLLLFLGAMLTFRVMFFVLSVLLAGAGFLIKSFVLLILLVPALPILLLIVGNLFSIMSIIFIVSCGLLISFLSLSDRRYS